MATERKLYIVGDIDWEQYKDFSTELTELESESSRPIKVELASDGGLAIVALAFASRMRVTKCSLHVTVMGSCASAAVLILAAGDKRSMPKEAWVMVHEEQAELGGSVTKLEEEVGQLRAMEEQWNALMEEYTTTSADKWSKLHKAVTYLTADRCLELGLIDEVI